MALQAKVGAFNLSTAAAGNTQAISGLGFQPKVVIFWTAANSTGSVDVMGAANAVLCFGVAISATDRRCVSAQTRSAGATSVTHHGHRDDACIAIIDSGSSVFTGLMDLQSMDSDGFTLVIDDAFPNATRMHYLAIGGADLTDFVTGSITEPAATGDQDTTTLTFQPDALFLFGVSDATAPPVISTTMMLHLGVAAGATPVNAVLANFSQQGVETSNTESYCRAGECIAIPASTGGLTARAAVTAWLSNGFRLNWTERAASRRVFFLALKGGSYQVGDLLTQTDVVTTIVESGFGFSPAAALFGSHAKAQSVADTPDVHSELSLGAFSSTADRGAQAFIDEDGLATMEVRTALEHDEVYANISLAEALEGLMDVQSVDADGFTCIMDDADPAQAFVWYLAMGSTPAGSGGRRLLMGVGS